MSGSYAILEITGHDGTVESFSLGEGCAFERKSSYEAIYVSDDPDYFGDDWLALWFPGPFTDINLWENSSILMLYENSLMRGTSGNTFSLEAVMTRGMFVTVLGRMAEIREADYRESAFEDVAPHDYFSPHITWAYQNGIVRGTTDQTFSPNTPITREQAVVLLARFAETQGLTFSGGAAYASDFSYVKEVLVDFADTSEEFQEKYASLFYLLQPKSGMHFVPAGTLTRREAANVLASAYESLYGE